MKPTAVSAYKNPVFTDMWKLRILRYCCFGYSVDSGPVQVIDLACGEKIPEDIMEALTDDAVIKWAL